MTIRLRQPGLGSVSSKWRESVICRVVVRKPAVTRTAAIHKKVPGSQMTGRPEPPMCLKSNSVPSNSNSCSDAPRIPRRTQ